MGPAPEITEARKRLAEKRRQLATAEAAANEASGKADWVMDTYPAGRPNPYEGGNFLSVVSSMYRDRKVEKLKKEVQDLEEELADLEEEFDALFPEDPNDFKSYDRYLERKNNPQPDPRPDE